MREKDLEEALAEKKRVREEGKTIFDATHNVRSKPLQVGDVVLCYDKVINDTDMSRKYKLNHKLLGLYRVTSVNPLGSFNIAEIDGVELSRSFTGSQLKRYFTRNRFFRPAFESDSDRSIESAVNTGPRLDEPADPSSTYTDSSVSSPSRLFSSSAYGLRFRRRIQPTTSSDCIAAKFLWYCGARSAIDGVPLLNSGGMILRIRG
jgi:hypothetical protein